MDWTALAKGFGIAGVRCATAEDFDAAFARSLASPGPHFIEATWADTGVGVP
jgi:acetolactate synthase-1/2/3 large subunit